MLTNKKTKSLCINFLTPDIKSKSSYLVFIQL